MSVLSSIRNRSGLLLLVIGFAMFAFLIGDLFRNGSSFFQGDQNVLGTIDGNEISRTEYNNLLQRFKDNPNAKNQVWDLLVSEKALENEYKKLGLEVSEEEFWNYYETTYGAQNPDFDINIVKSQITKAVANPNSQSFQQWKMQEDAIKSTIKRQKYQALLTSTELVNSAESNYLTKLNADNLQLQVAQIPYPAIEKTTKVEVTDVQIKNYINEHSEDFKQKEARDLQYVVFNIEPRQEDRDLALKSVESYLKDQVINDKLNGVIDTVKSFAKVTNDSAYIATLDVDAIKLYPGYFEESQLPNDKLKQFVKTASVNQVYGPYQNNDVYLLTKYLGKKQVADSSHVQHILISYNGAERATVTRNKVEAKAIADSLATVLKANPTQYTELAKKMSDDTGVKQNDGKYWVTFSQQGLAKEFKDFAVEGAKGDLKVVETMFGFHIMKVIGKKDFKTVYNLTTIGKEAKPSEQTQNFYFQQATKFAQESTVNLKQFTEDAQKLGKEVRTETDVDQNKSVLSGLDNGTSTELVDWSFKKDRKVGDNEKFNLLNGYVVAYLSAKHKEGTQSVEKAKVRVSSILKNDLLFDEAVKTIGQEKDLGIIASKFEQQVKTIDNVNFNSQYIQNLGDEPAVIGAAYQLALNGTSGIIKGKTGVFVVKNLNKKPSGTDAKVVKTGIENKYNQHINSFSRALEKLTNIDDARNNFK